VGGSGAGAGAGVGEGVGDGVGVSVGVQLTMPGIRTMMVVTIRRIIFIAVTLLSSITFIPDSNRFVNSPK